MNEDFRSTSTSTVTVGVSAPYTGAFFPRSRNLAIAGGVFTSNVTNIYNCPPVVPCDFRRIPLGDLDLRHEIRFEWDSDTAYRRHYGGSARKFYSARIHGCNTNLTAAVYQGEAAEEYLRDTVLKYSWLRHPNIVQLFGTVNTSGIHAVIYHDDLVPAKQILEHYRRSHLRTVLFWRYMDAEFKDARDHLRAVIHWALNSWDCTIWIRSSTGRVAIELIPSSHELNIFQRERSGFLLSPMEPHPDSEIIASLSISDYHLICSHHLRKDRIFSLSTQNLIAPGAVYWCPRGSSFDDATAIACFPGGDISGWHNSRPGAGHPLVPGINGWTRINSCDAVGRHLKCLIMSRSFDNRTWWCAQANHIFDRLGSISDYEEYVLVDRVTDYINVSGSKENIPSGYLFLCSFTDLRADASPIPCEVPDWEAYWSFDPAGVERLNTDEAKRLGFPSLTLKREISGFSWDRNVYAGMRQYHEAKGFDPDTQELARHLGFPLYQLSSGLDPLFSNAVCEIDDSPIKM